MISIFIIILIIVVFLAYVWFEGIDNMQTKYPTYSGEDFLDGVSKGKKEAWDDNKQHTEQDIR